VNQSEPIQRPGVYRRMKPLIRCPAFFVLMLWVSGCATAPRHGPEPEPRPLPALKPMNPGVKIADRLYDTTETWQARFGLGGKLVIADGRRDLRGPLIDGPIELSFHATPTRSGCYTFVFVYVDGFDKPQRVVAIHLWVYEGVKNSKPPVITPDPPPGPFDFHVAPNEPVFVRWYDYEQTTSFGGTWRLTDVIYTDSTDFRDRPGIPGYDYKSGE